MFIDSDERLEAGSKNDLDYTQERRWKMVEEQRGFPTCYVVGWNQPGYMPETDPVQFDNFDSAREYAEETLRNWFEGDGNIAENDPLFDVIPLADTDGKTYWNVFYDNYLLWVTPHQEDNR